MAHGVPSPRIAFVLALFMSVAWLPTIHAQVVDEHEGFFIFDHPKGSNRTILVSFKARPAGPAEFAGQPTLLKVVFRGNCGGRDAEEDEDLTETSEARLFSFTGTTDETADQFVFGEFDCGPEKTAAHAEKQLCNLLSKKIAVVSRKGKLSDVQKLKIELAGRGDVARLLDGARRLKLRFEQYAQIHTADEIEEWASGIAQERKRMQILLGSGMFGDGTLFHKVLMTVLTSEQTEMLK